MKLKENDIKITETYALKTGKSHAEKVEIFKMEFICILKHWLMIQNIKYTGFLRKHIKRH